MILTRHKSNLDINGNRACSRDVTGARLRDWLPPTKELGRAVHTLTTVLIRRSCPYNATAARSDQVFLRFLRFLVKKSVSCG